MADPRLIEYIKQNLNAGYSPDELDQVLVNQGWKRDEVADALREVRTGQSYPAYPDYASSYSTPAPQAVPAAQQAPSIPQYQKLGMMDKFRMVIRSPTVFFNMVKPEKDLETPVTYFLFLLFIQVIVSNAILIVSLAFGSMVFNISTINPLLGTLTALTVDNFISANVMIALTLVFVAFWSLILNFFIRLLGGKGAFVDTFKGVIYASSPNVLLTLISIPMVAIVLLFPAGNVGADGTPAIEEVILPLLIVGGVQAVLQLVFLVWNVYLMLKGLSIFHEKSKLIVLAAIIVMGVVISIISFVLVMIVAILLAPFL